jgi:hypothetical protein
MWSRYRKVKHIQLLQIHKCEADTGKWNTFNCYKYTNVKQIQESEIHSTVTNTQMWSRYRKVKHIQLLQIHKCEADTGKWNTFNCYKYTKIEIHMYMYSQILWYHRLYGTVYSHAILHNFRSYLFNFTTTVS